MSSNLKPGSSLSACVKPEATMSPLSAKRRPCKCPLSSSHAHVVSAAGACWDVSLVCHALSLAGPACFFCLSRHLGCATAVLLWSVVRAAGWFLWLPHVVRTTRACCRVCRALSVQLGRFFVSLSATRCPYSRSALFP